MQPRYLDPKNDLVFKRIFGEHPHILRSFLNALLPLAAGEQIVSLEYLAPEQVPQIPLLKHSIVDVRCRDEKGRYFIVEMQMNWTSAFLQRVLFNASKAYVRQLEKGERYELLQPVTGLSVLDDIFDRESDDYYHHYRLVNVQQPKRVIEGMQLVFIELPKFKLGQAQSPLKEAWLRFLRETGEEKTPAEHEEFQTEVVAQAPEIREATELSGEAAFSPGELETYDRYWDIISTERTLISGKYAEGLAAGEARAKAGLLARLLATGMTESEAQRLLGP